MSTESRIRELERDLARLSARVPLRQPQSTTATDALVPYLQATARGGNRLITSPDNVYGIKRKSGEAKPTAWIYAAVQASGLAQLGTLAPNVGKITSIFLTNRGQAYLSAPSITIGPPPLGGTQATATCTIVDNDRVIACNVTACGTGYTTPTVTFAPPVSGTTATGVAVVRDGKLVGIEITNQGSGYTSAPAVTISGGGSAAATAIMSKGIISTITMTNNGAGYTSVPTVTITEPTGMLPFPLPPRPGDDSPSAYEDGVGWATAFRGSLNGATNTGTLLQPRPTVLVCHDDRSLLPYGLMGDGPTAVPGARAPDSFLSWYETFMRLTTTDADADGILPAYVPMAGGA